MRLRTPSMREVINRELGLCRRRGQPANIKVTRGQFPNWHLDAEDQPSYATAEKVAGIMREFYPRFTFSLALKETCHEAAH